MIDLRTCVKGQKLLCRNGEIVKYSRYAPGLSFPHIILEKDGREGSRTDNGWVWKKSHSENDGGDIVQVLVSTSQKISLILSRIEADLEELKKLIKKR